MKEASFYVSESGGKVKCLLCPKSCRIPDGGVGVCGTRENFSGKLYALTYSKPVALHLDPIEKKPLYHFHPGAKILSVGTLGCNLNCRFCQNFDISQQFEKEDFDNITEVSPEQILSICLNSGYKFVAFTYNEPTIFFEYMIDIAELCKKNGIKTVAVSNGQINEEPLVKLVEYIDAFNIDLKSFNPDFYRKICGGEIKTTKRAIEIISEKKRHLEVTFLLIEGLNDDREEFTAMCGFLAGLDRDIVLHISRAFPRYKMDFDPTPLELINDFQKTASKYLNHVYAGNV
ncbi:MAG TPA: AmmeMemoRadiSam system radical SAM enzyme [Ignavibacteria bacterium]|nr:AmmeMemoRadiSam system radical SAM enzyme [Ignavibacteria bacterium]